MSDLLVVGISDYKVAREPETLVTYALGSCVGICIYDRKLKMGGLAHIMLPDSTAFSNSDNRMKFADTAIVDMVNDLKMLGSLQTDLTAKIAGGAQMFGNSDDMFGSIGDRNVNSVRNVLRKLRIPIVAEDRGANYGRPLYFYLDTGRVKTQSLSRGVKEL